MHTLVLWKRGESDAGLGALSQCHHRGPQLSQSLCSTILSVGLLASDLLPRGSTIVVVAPTIMSAIKTKRKKRKNRKRNRNISYVCLFIRKANTFRNPTANFPLRFTVQSWVNFHLDKIRILLERKSIRQPKTQN